MISRPKYVSAAVAGDILGVSPRTIRRWVALGVLPGKHVGDGLRAPVRVAEADVLALLRDIPTA